MKIKKELLQAFLDKYAITAALLAREMGVAVAEVEKLLSGTAVSEETAASERTQKAQMRNAHLRFARRSSAPVTTRATHGRRQPPVCAGGLSITSPPRNTVTLFFLRGLYG